MINGVILNKFSVMDEILTELKSLGQVTTAQLDQDWKVRRAKMIQFRNFIVHRYEKVDTAILVEIINRRLSDFKAFREEISRYVYRMENT